MEYITGGFKEEGGGGCCNSAFKNIYDGTN